MLSFTLSGDSDLTLVTVPMPLPTPLSADEPSQPQFETVPLFSLTPATPPVTIRPPSSGARDTIPATLVRCACEISGPRSVSGSAGSPTTIFDITSATPATKSSYRPCATIARVAAVQS